MLYVFIGILLFDLIDCLEWKVLQGCMSFEDDPTNCTSTASWALPTVYLWRPGLLSPCPSSLAICLVICQETSIIFLAMLLGCPVPLLGCYCWLEEESPSATHYSWGLFFPLIFTH